MIIGLIGGSACTEETYRFAEKVGEGIARAGGTVICGGKTGTMEAVCKGASSAGGRTIGILPSADVTEANDYVDVPVATGMGVVRNAVIVRTADVLIAMDGAEGTLSEIALAMNIGKHVVAVTSWEFLMQDNLPTDLLHFVSTPEEAVNTAVELSKKEKGTGKLW